MKPDRADRAESRSPGRTPLGRSIALFVIAMLSLWLMAWILPGLAVEGWGAAVMAVGVIAVLNAVIWPLVARYLSGPILWTAGLLGLVGNGLVVYAAAEVVDGFAVSSVWTAIVASLGMTAISAVAGQLFALDDDAVWQRRVIHRMVQRREPPEHTDVPGVLFLQIDGLSETVLRRAIGEGFMPTVADWLRSGTHRLQGWECDLSSQTGASQAGILHGDNTNMPAFRWYEKSEGRVYTSNRPGDAADIERLRSDGGGLLAAGGVSRANVFSGDSPDAMFTFSTIRDRDRRNMQGFTYFVANPYAISRLMVLSLADIGRELAASWRARRRNIQPRMKRGGVYPIARAATTVMLRDITIYTLLADIYRGVPSAYVDFVGYDEVAHHSGIAAHDALETLYRLDQQFARLVRAIEEAPRPYHIVVLSDHGQTQGATFLQRYGISLPDLVKSLIATGDEVDAPRLSDEGWGNINGILTDTISDEDTRLARMVRVLVRRRTVDGEVVLGPAARTDEASAASSDGPSDVIVLASGNLGLISFPDLPGRATLETIALRHPELIRGLIAHPGIGFILVRSETVGSIVIGRHGVRYLADDEVEGEDPLEPFGERAADHVRRTDSFDNTPDILVNGFYDPDVDEGAAFEELIGFHGGLGGKQTEPFVLHPATFSDPDVPIVGAAAVHELFTSWLADIGRGEGGEPWATPDDADDAETMPDLPGLRP